MSNKFEQYPNDGRNDLIDSGVGFVVSFGFFVLVYALFQLFKYFSQFT